MNETMQLVLEMKETNSDFEFYPTTEPMVRAIAEHMQSLETGYRAYIERKNGSRTDLRRFALYNDYNLFEFRDRGIIDLCAGDGRVVLQLKEMLSEMSSYISVYGIEKSPVLLRELRKAGVTVVGTEFFETSLITKTYTLAFINPPYSEYDSFLQRALESAEADIIYAIVPQRWREHKGIAHTLEHYDYTLAESVMKTDFLEADRAARAKVEIVAFSRKIKRYEDEGDAISRVKSPVSHFDRMCEELIGLRADVSRGSNAFREYEAYESEKQAFESQFDITVRAGLAEALVASYDDKQAMLLKNYKAVGDLDAAVLQTLNVDVEAVKIALRDQHLGEKRVYWRLLFEHLPELTDRLSTRQKRAMQEKLNSVDLDFTMNNIRFIVSMSALQATESREDTLTEVFLELFSPDSIKPYVSNDRVFKDTFRWQRVHDKDSLPRCRLDYRFIHSDHGFFEQSWNGRLDVKETLYNFVEDLAAVMNLLGYSVFPDRHALSMTSPGELVEMTSEGKVMATLRFHKNGNVHVKFDQSFIRRWNVTVSRLLGWVKSKAEYTAETGEEVRDSDWRMRDTLVLGGSDLLSLEGPRAAA